MTRHADMLLRDLANAGESARRALDRAGLDFCCEGNQTLQHACEVAGVDAHVVEDELGTRDDEAGSIWGSRGVTELIDHIVEVVHPRTKRLLDELTAARSSLPKLDAASRELGQAIDALAWQARLQMNEEEQVVFARARALAEAREGRGPFPATFRTTHEQRARLQEGHATTHKYLRRLRSLVGNRTGPGTDRLRACVDALAGALMEQIHLENNELIPRALDLEPNGQDLH